MMTVSKICDAVGRERIANAVGVKGSAVKNAVAANQFPASWFVAVSELCRDKAVDCPLELFSFKHASAAE